MIRMDPPRSVGTLNDKYISLDWRSEQVHKMSYYINTNEIPSEPSRENMISSHVQRSLLLWLHIKIAPFDAFCEMI